MREKVKHPALKYCPEFTGELYVETHYEVCPACDGHGVHERRDIDITLLTDQWREEGDDEAMEAYMGGRFDVTCTECGGKRVVPQWNLEDLPRWAQEAIMQWNQDEADYRAEVAAERRMGV